MRGQGGFRFFTRGCYPDAETVASLDGGPVLAFAGIGSPEKFFTTLSAAGIALAATRSFDDHHRYTRAEATALCELAERQGLVLVTTEKDLARMHGDAETAQLAERVRALPVTLRFEDEAAFRLLLFARLAAARTPRAGRVRHRNTLRLQRISD